MEGSEDLKNDFYVSVYDEEYEDEADTGTTSYQMPSTSYQEGKGVVGEINEQTGRVGSR